MSNLDSTVRHLVQEIVHLTRKVLELEQERNQYKDSYIEERQKNLHLERELLERECSHVYDSEREMDCPPTAHGETDPQLQGTTDQQSQTDESGKVSG